MDEMLKRLEKKVQNRLFPCLPNGGDQKWRFLRKNQSFSFLWITDF